jgi:pyruvate dehydrogenase E2 component (dihydrolipoamide acetyltransferase)
MDFRVPELGEGIESATVVRLLVTPGTSVSAGQDLVELETDKATVPVPATNAGTVEKIMVKAGEKIRPGAVLLTLKDGATAPAKKEADKAPAAKPQPAEPAKPRTTGQEKPAKQRATEQEEPKAKQPAAPQAAREAPQAAPGGNGKGVVAAGPATRRLARELGVDLHHVFGTARGGRVTQDDVKAFVRGLPKGDGEAPHGVPVTAAAAPPLPDFSKYGPIEKRPFTSLRKAVARNTTLAWTFAPQVTQHDSSDITELESARKRFVESLPKGAPKVTMTVLAMKAVVAALKAFPHFNASYDVSAGENGELILKRYYHIGVAVDTERGLLVPVIRDADRKGLGDLAKELGELAEKARSGKLTIEEMRGGTFTISNLGGIGGTAFSPIINYPEVAILGISRSAWQPVVRGGRIEPRLVLPLSLTYDHRVIDGADGARFITKLSAALSDPMRLLFES